ncbi:hypothetical protein QTI66_00360 [Variovorax sp. J22R133]|uniref:hypothetical protein n=1 Tax=Variovorax brevis TaxID=3053503 RepID=UPI002575B422|nr:hypothetical protein [Variovorax sp. J22R133]MDM0110577.1 hypothetical protein [Variovorax sp. J22R133]
MEKELEMFVEAAEQLEHLKATLAEQGNASTRLRALVDAVDKVADQIGRVPQGLSVVLSRAESAEKKLQVAVEQVQALKDSVPALIARFESSDVGRSIDSLTTHIAASREELRGFRSAAADFEMVVEQIRSAGETARHLVATEISKAAQAQERTIGAIGSLRAEVLEGMSALSNRIDKVAGLWEGAGAATANAFTQTTSAIKSAGERHSEVLQQIAALRNDVGAIGQVVTQQANSIKVLSTKKGLLF